jgi:lipopolysaccharide biosynthesis glycosyltransferase
VVFHTCVNSIIRHATRPISIIPLALNLLHGYHETHADGSNQFIYSRFLVPWLQHWSGWAIFMDGDMVVQSDITQLWDLREFDKDVMVVKHDYKTKLKEKYLGSPNQDYPRKNWSSVVLWNCSNFPNRLLTPEFVQQKPGSFLHRFAWLDNDRIGSLPLEWNWLPDEYGANPNAKLLHYTLGTPCFKEFAQTTQAQEWHQEHALANHCEQHTP